jgi:alkanesulfonate monooxygenase SsuD/methylene tetrahydromethanopterin reductase-like flavin-dependent oxidoreductase (luciferase family)
MTQTQSNKPLKLGVFSANTNAHNSRDTLIATATLAEELCMESLWAAEHSVIPLGYDSRYPSTHSAAECTHRSTRRDRCHPNPADTPTR